MTTAKVYVYRTYTSMLDKASYFSLFRSMPIGRQSKANSFVFSKDKKLCVTAWGLLQTALKDVGLDCENLTFTVGFYGKPSIADENIYFNLSHSGDAVLCVLSLDCEVGCDVERIGCYNSDLSKVCFHPFEIAKIEAELDLKHKSEVFFQYWTLKESYLKALGVGMNIELSSFFAFKQSDSFHIELTSGEGRVCSLKSLSFDDDYQYSICAMSSNVELIFPKGASPLQI